MKIGIVGVSGFGGSELPRLIASHPSFKLAWVGGESSAVQRTHDVMRKKRRLALQQIRSLNEKLNVPAEVSIRDYALA